jgi:hypothetical protein
VEADTVELNAIILEVEVASTQAAVEAVDLTTIGIIPEAMVALVSSLYVI